MLHLVGDILTNDSSIVGQLNKAYVGLTLMPKRGDGSKSITIEHCGDYEVRLTEFSQSNQDSDCIFWLELYCHITQSSLDSCRCDNLDDAEIAAEYLVSYAKQLRDAP
jgi:hypothetical protein